MSPSDDPIPTPQSGLPNPLQPEAQSPPKLDADAKPRHGRPQAKDPPAGEKSDYDRGAEAGKDKKPGQQPEADEERPSKSFEHGYLDAQKVRSDEKPPT